MALRRSCATLTPAEAPDARGGYGALRYRLCMDYSLLAADTFACGTSNQTLSLVAPGMLRTHVLRCYAVLISDLTADLRHRASSRGLQAAVGVLTEIRVLAGTFVDQSSVSAPWAPANYTAELLAELRASGLLEHWARLVVVLPACGSGSTEALEKVRSTTQTLLGADMWRAELLQDSPCLSYLLSAHTVRLAAALDGGPTYGMPTAAAAAEAGAQVAESDATEDAFFAACLPVSPRGYADTAPAQWALGLWQNRICSSRAELIRDLRDASKPDREGSPAASAAGAASAPNATAGSPNGPAASATGGGWRQARWRLQVRPVPPAVVDPSTDGGVSAVPSGAGGSAVGASGSGAGPSTAGVAPVASLLPEQLRRWVGCAAVPPLHTRAAFEVSLRLAAAAVEQLGAPRRQRRSGAASSSGFRPTEGTMGRLYEVEPSQAAALAVRALACAKTARMEVAMLPSVPGWVQQRLERYWRLLLAATDALRQQRGRASREMASESWSWEELRGCLAALRVADGAGACLPPGPSPDVAAALSAGWVAFVERMLRNEGATAQPPRPPPPALSLARLPPAEAAAAWGQVLAFGPRRATLALIVTAAKRLRSARRDIARLRWHCGWAPELPFSALPLRWLLRMAHDTERRQRAASAAAGAGTAGAVVGAEGGADAAAPGAQGNDEVGGGGGNGGGANGGGAAQLRLTLTCMALHLVPTVCLELPWLAGVTQRPGPEVRTRNAAITFFQAAAPEVLGWLPLLAAAQRRADWAAAGRAADTYTLACGLGGALVAALLEKPGSGVQRRLLAAIRYTMRALQHLLSPESMLCALQATRTLAAALSSDPLPRGSAGHESHCGCAALRRVLGPRGVAPEPELLAALTEVCKSCGTDSGAAAAGRNTAGGGSVGGTARGVGAGSNVTSGGGERCLPADVQRWVDAAALLMSPEEVQAELPLCGYPTCVNLQGHSEAELPSQRVAGHGAGSLRRYCSTHCRDQDLMDLSRERRAQASG